MSVSCARTSSCTTTEAPRDVPTPDDVVELSINTIRAARHRRRRAAGIEHPGTPMALAPLGHLLFTRYLKCDPSDPGWPDRDRFVLSAADLFEAFGFTPSRSHCWPRHRSNGASAGQVR